MRPLGARLYETEPEWVAVHLRSTFIDDWIARYIVTHELGHALGLDHSATLDDIMYHLIQTNRSVDPFPSQTEAYVARLLQYVPVGSDCAWYVGSGE